MTTNVLGRNEAMKLLLQGREARRIDAVTGARSQWRPLRRLVAKPDVCGVTPDARGYLYRRALIVETVAAELASYLGAGWRSDA